MELKQERTLPLPRQTVWEALNDPAVLQACIPGCESFEQVDDNAYDARVTAKIGPVKARFKGHVTLEDVQPPESYTLNFQGQGGQAGFVRGSASVSLAEEDGGCRLSYTTKATLGGKLAQLGSRLVDGAARKTANRFFDNFVRHMGVEEEVEDEEQDEAKGQAKDAAGDETEAMTAQTAPDDRGGSDQVWVWVVVGAAVIIAVILITVL